MLRTQLRSSGERIMPAPYLAQVGSLIDSAIYLD